MNGSGRRFAAWSLWTTSLIALLAGYWFAFLLKDREQLAPDSVALGLGFATFATVGALIISRRSRNILGWLCLLTGLFASFTLLGSEYLTFATRHHLPRPVLVAWITQWTWNPTVGAALLVLPLFPDGRSLSSRWRPVVWALTAAIAILTIGWMLRPGPLDNAHEIMNPVGVPILHRLESVGGGAAAILLILGMIGALAEIIVRFRRSTGETRLQLKWFTYAAGLTVSLSLIAGALESAIGPTAGNVLFAVGVLSIPTSIAVAILRYRLYDIDVIINKTVVYGALAAFITLVYAGVVVGIGSIVGSRGKPNLALSLAATAIVAVAFQPVRERVQRFANKLVYGERVTPYEAVTSFSHRMSESLSLDLVLPQMAEAAAKGVGGTRGQVKLFLPVGGEQAVTWPLDTSAESFDRTLKVVHQGEEVGEISVAKTPGEQVTKSEEKLLSDLASQAGLAMRNLRLTGELQQKLVELQESRKRIVAAQDEERRRMERDIHDGAQQQLVAMSVKLGLARSLASKDPDKAGALLDDLKAETQDAVESVRHLARGLFPQILADQGLVAALQSHVAKTGLDASIQDELAGARPDPEIEANVYFVIREALQNASKHAPGVPIEIRLASKDGVLEFSIADQGPGFDAANTKAGSGLQNMMDRVEALAGDFTVNATPGTGTLISGRVPARATEVIA